LLTATAATGGEAIRQLESSPPDVIIIDVMLPEMDGFQICRAIKQSRKYSHIAVILMSAVIGSERITDEVLARHGADAYFEKPLDTDKIKEHVSGLLQAPERRALVGESDGFERAIDLYKSGDIDGAIRVLRAGLAVDPLSAKHHFVLANLLQTQSLLYEAIDEYEATVELKPDYFPALTRLAYLYYKKGFAAKAVEVWRRSLACCPDPALRQNIERFIARLADDMKSQP
jgi:CheY-like chemotaxis protein